MKKFILAALVLFSLFQSAQARGIVGKWYCTNAFLDSLGLAYYYGDLDGYCKFDNDGMFTVRISGEMVSRRSSEASAVGALKAPKWMRYKSKYQTLLIKVKGTYRFDGSTITTVVDTADVHVYINTGLEYPEDPDAGASRAEFYWKNTERNLFDKAERHAAIQAQMIRREKMGLWTWNNLPVTLGNGVMQVGDLMRFTRKKERGFGMGEGSEVAGPHRYSTKEVYASSRSALKILDDIGSSEKDRAWAVKILEKTVEKDSSAYWMFHLGVAYVSDNSVKRDTAKAVMLLRKAGQTGYGKAYKVLGDMYKDGKGGVCQDVSKAYYYYSLGADLHDKNCMYHKGYMLTKGIGCRQSYSDAVLAFLPAANWPDAESLYMLGVFLRNGYGVAKDSLLAVNSLQRAARMHCPEASEELMRPHEETYMHDVYANAPGYSYIPDSLPDVRPSAVAVDLPAGDYRGFIVTYDWSGKYILDERPFAMTLHGVTGGGLSGTLTVGDESAKFCGTLSGGRLVFTEGGLTMPDRYVRGGKQYYDFGDMALEAFDGKVRGRLSLKSRSRKEPGNPMYFELVGNASGASAGTE